MLVSGSESDVSNEESGGGAVRSTPSDPLKAQRKRSKRYARTNEPSVIIKVFPVSAASSIRTTLHFSY
jgi:hypothetical protein